MQIKNQDTNEEKQKLSPAILILLLLLLLCFCCVLVWGILPVNAEGPISAPLHASTQANYKFEDENIIPRVNESIIQEIILDLNPFATAQIAERMATLGASLLNPIPSMTLSPNDQLTATVVALTVIPPTPIGTVPLVPSPMPSAAAGTSTPIPTVAPPPKPTTPPPSIPNAFDDSDITNLGVAVTTSVLSNDDLGTTPTSITANTNGTNGTVNCTATQCQYTPGGGFSGIDTYTYTITDNNSLTDTATVTITVVDLPDALNDSDSTYEGIAVTTSVLGNDDLGTTPTTITAKTNGSNGTVICTTTQCEYTPGGGFTGIDTYTYTITDNNSNTDTATVTITVTPCAAPGGSGFVSSYDPIDTQTGVPVAVSPKIYFNQDMDYASLDQYDKFHVALCGNGGCGQIVSPVAIIISSTTYANDTVTLNPNVDLNPSMTYYIMAGTQIENACNTAQGSFETAEFTTAP